MPVPARQYGKFMRRDRPQVELPEFGEWILCVDSGFLAWYRSESLQPRMSLWVKRFALLSDCIIFYMPVTRLPERKTKFSNRLAIFNSSLPLSTAFVILVRTAPL